MVDLLNVDTAIERILEQITRKKAISVSLQDALHRVLAADIISELNLPPFDNAAMDGFAIRSQDSTGASSDHPVSLKVTMDVPAGTNPTQMLNPGEAARIMTGAPIPPGADTVIPVEDTSADFSQASESVAARVVDIHRVMQARNNIRQAGENIHVGQTVLTAGTTIRPAEIGLLAALGKSSVQVIAQPRVIILGSGDELIGIDEPLTPGKIRDTNSYTLAALVAENGGQAVRLPIAGDNPDELRSLFQNALAQNPDMIISSAGVSVGAADYVRTLLEEMGEIGFWRINLRPGKPLAFGFLDGVPFFGLPGNPVSAMITFDVLVRLALLKLGGRVDNSVYVTAFAGENITSDGRRTYARIILKKDDDRFVAYTTGTQSSGAFMSMVIADGLMIIPEGVQNVERGTALTVKLLKPISTE